MQLLQGGRPKPPTMFRHSTFTEFDVYHTPNAIFCLAHSVYPYLVNRSKIYMRFQPVTLQPTL